MRVDNFNFENTGKKRKKSFTNKAYKTHKTYKTNNKDFRQRVDFERLAVKEIAEILRRMGETFFDNLLTGGPCPELKLLLSKEDCLTLAWSYTWKLIRCRIKNKGNKGERPKRLGELIREVRSGRVAADRWQVESCNRVALALGGTAGEGLPDALWPVAAEVAWKNPRFLYKTASNMFQYFRREVLFFPYEVPGIEFSVRTFWVLTASALPDRMTFRQWISPRRRKTVEVAMLLREEARRQIMKKGWAGYWDQWLIKKALTTWPDAFKRLDDGLLKSLAALPLAADSFEVRMLMKSLEPGTRMQKLLKKLRRFFEQIKRNLGLLKTYDTGILELRAPNWKAQAPDNFIHFMTPRSEPAHYHEEQKTPSAANTPGMNGKRGMDDTK